MANWNEKEITGRQYVYCSKNAVSDVAASNFFGKAAAWVSNGSYAVGDRVTSSSIQYRNKTGVNTTTAPASDTTNWEFDLENYQIYSTSRGYLVGHKTNYNNEHYICTTNTTGTFNPAHWNKVIVSNKDVPYKLMNTGLNMMYADGRFVSNEVLDYVNNVDSVDANLLISNGIWNETLTNPTKIVKIIGQSKFKTRFEYPTNYVFSNFRFKNINFSTFIGNNGAVVGFGAENCTFLELSCSGFNAVINLMFFYKNCIRFISQGTSTTMFQFSHFVNNTVLSVNMGTANPQWTNKTIFKNNYIKGIFRFGVPTNSDGVNIVPIGNIDYNSFEGNCNVNGVSQTSLAMLQATLPNQNIHSRYDSGVTFNSDYTLPSGSVLLGTGSNGNNIGAEGRGYVDTKDTIFSTSNGALYRNLKITGTYIERDQISLLAQANSGGNMILNSSASSKNEEYTGFRIYISSGTGSGQTRTIASYNGTTKAITVTVAWTTLPDATSVYEILDGELTSGFGDLGSVQTVRKMLLSNNPVYKVDKLTIDKAVSITDPRLDNPAGMTYDLKVSNASDLGGASFVRFVQDEEFKIDSNNKGCGSEDYNSANVVTNTLTFRYYQVKLMFRK